MEHKIEVKKDNLLGSISFIESQVLNGITIKTSYRKADQVYKVEYINGYNSAIVRFYKSSGVGANKYSPLNLRSLHNIYLGKFFDYDGNALDLDQLDTMTKNIIQDLLQEALVIKLQPTIDYGINNYNNDILFNGLDMVHYSNLLRDSMGQPRKDIAISY